MRARSPQAPPPSIVKTMSPQRRSWARLWSAVSPRRKLISASCTSTVAESRRCRATIKVRGERHVELRRIGEMVLPGGRSGHQVEISEITLRKRGKIESFADDRLSRRQCYLIGLI